jgi:hypothetical protein
MVELSVQIVGFVSAEPQPGVIACEFADAENRTHRVVDKVPIFSAAHLDGRSSYPLQGVVRCEVMASWKDASGRQLVRITTGVDCVESTTGLSEFVVLRDQLLSSGT